MFSFNAEEVDESCAVTHENKYYIFGGRVNTRQVLQLDNCRLTSIGSIDFTHDGGACGSANGVIILCFNTVNSMDYKRCRQAATPNGPWTEMALSTYDHKDTSIATSTGSLLTQSSVLLV